ncbi:MAG: tRNA (adenosine(37)-N6)-threonylcarbamoyltransferase complex dimerization subunit type 1 TsaB [Cyclobacteriaceae bacterium]
MAIILSLETSSDVCSVALHDGGRLMAEAEIHEPQSHSARLALLIKDILATANFSSKDLNAVAITKGPGSYTGLRIGTSTAKGLCYALDIPLISVGSLELLAYQASGDNSAHALLCPMIDARRMEVYCLVTNHRLEIVQPVSAMVIDQASFQELLTNHKMLFFGNGANKCKEVLHHVNAGYLDNIFPLAATLGLMAESKYRDGVFEDLNSFKPFYLKEFVAKKPQKNI